MNSNSSVRTIYFDYLRFFATFAVVVIHVSAYNWLSTDINSFEWKVFNFSDSLVRWGVPIFVMISGALFLDREIRMKHIYSKYILRLVISFVVWSFLYVIVKNESNTEKILHFVKGSFHMWFIPMMICIYMCLPFIKPIVASENRIKYYLLLSLIFTFIMPECSRLMRDFGNEFTIKLFEMINKNFETMHIPLGYVGYFVLGYYLNKKDLGKHQRIGIYCAGIIGFISTAVLTSIVSLKAHQAQEYYYSYFCVNILAESIAVFVFFKNTNFNNVKMNLFMRRISKYSFGVFLVHPFVISLLNKVLGLNTLSFNPAFSVIVISGIVFIFSNFISCIFNKIPYVNKYIV